MEKNIEKEYRNVLVLAAIVMFGFFLRTYNLHDWLHFGKDQARDALITQAVARGEESWPLLGAAMGNTDFKIGPIYYYFQIISAKIFGQDPSALAYPDVLFSILSILLLYFFLKRYFSQNISLFLAGLYAISYFSVEYARFAWNPNPIPFFVILFVMSTYELLASKEKTRWKWIVAAGLAMGGGTQLHAILLVLMPTWFLLVSIFLLRKSRNSWRKILAVFVIGLFLNVPQIISEFQSDFANTKSFLASSSGTSEPGNRGLMNNLKLNVACHAQANMHMVSSLGDKYNCNFVSIMMEKDDGMAHRLSVLLVAASFIFSVFGYCCLFYRSKNDGNENKRYFLGLIVLYCALYFPLLMPAIDGASHRYFIGLIFVPYVFLGFLLEFFFKKGKLGYSILAVFVLAFFAISNLFSIFIEASQLQSGTRGNSGYAVLGQMEEIRNYMLSQIGDEKEVYLLGGSKYLPFYAVPMQYVFARRDIKIIRIVDDSKALRPGAPVFYIWKNSNGKGLIGFNGRSVLEQKDFGRLGIYKLQNGN